MNLTGKNIVVLTGAGISAESGLKTFRDADGLWEGHRVEDVATPEAFARDPELVYRFYNLRRQQLKEVEPNKAHLALAEFEKEHNANFLLVTQNVDDLHERAGSKNILHMHGELRKARCLKTDEVFEWAEDFDANTPHPKTKEKALLRPHICWFGEIPFYMDETQEALRQADVFIAIGTSGAVYPAAGFVQMVSIRCDRVLINKDSPENHSSFEQTLLGPATELVPKFFVEAKA